MRGKGVEAIRKENGSKESNGYRRSKAVGRVALDPERGFEQQRDGCRIDEGAVCAVQLLHEGSLMGKRKNVVILRRKNKKERQGERDRFNQNKKGERKRRRRREKPLR
jgi:hypothetical protein